MSEAIIYLLICVIFLVSCSNRDVVPYEKDIRKYESNRIYSILVHELSIYDKENKTIDIEFYDYKFTDEKVMDIGKSIKSYAAQYNEAIYDYKKGVGYNLKSTIIPKLMNVVPKAFYYQFSRIGFNTTYDFAVVYEYISNTELLNTDVVVLLKKNGTTWRIISEIMD
jgi:hypothetical protein